MYDSGGDFDELRWTVHGERPLYTNRWMDLRLVDVELPDGRRFDHHAVRVAPSAGTVVVVDGRALLVWRHRFITDTWGFEIPAGKIDDGESPTVPPLGRWRKKQAGDPAHCGRCCICSRPGHHRLPSLRVLREQRPAGRPAGDPAEAERVVWVPLAEVRNLIDKGRLVSGSTIAALLYVLSSRLGGRLGSQTEEK